MTVRLNEERLEVKESSLLSKVVSKARSRCQENGEILVQIIVNGDPLTQEEWEEISEQEVGGKSVELISEPREALSLELSDRAMGYLEDLKGWLEDHHLHDAESTDKYQELVEGLGWLNAAIEQIAPEESGRLIVNGQPLTKFQHQSGLFLAELQGALENYEQNGELLKTLLSQELPGWLERYESTFKQLRTRLEGDHFD